MRLALVVLVLITTACELCPPYGNNPDCRFYEEEDEEDEGSEGSQVPDSPCAMIAAATLAADGVWLDLEPAPWPVIDPMPTLHDIPGLWIDDIMQLHTVPGLPPPARQYYEWLFSGDPNVGDVVELVVPDKLPGDTSLGSPTMSLYGPSAYGIPWILTRSAEFQTQGFGAWGHMDDEALDVHSGSSHLPLGPLQLNWINYEIDSYAELDGTPIQWTPKESVIGYVADHDAVVAGRGFARESQGYLTHYDGKGFHPFAGWCVPANAPGQDSTG